MIGSQGSLAPDPSTVVVHLLALRVFLLFAATAEMRLEVAKQGGLEYLLSLCAWGEKAVSKQPTSLRSKNV